MPFYAGIGRGVLGARVSLSDWLALRARVRGGVKIPGY